MLQIEYNGAWYRLAQPPTNSTIDAIDCIYCIDLYVEFVNATIKFINVINKFYVAIAPSNV